MLKNLRSFSAWRKLKGRRGSILAITFLLCMLGAMATLWMVMTLQDHQRTNQHRREINRAYFAAQAGIQQILHWGNFPDDFDGLGPGGLFYRDPETWLYPNLIARMAPGSAEISINKNRLGSFKSKHGYDVGHIEELVLIPRDPFSDPLPCFFKIRSKGVSAMGLDREILAYIRPNRIANPAVLKLPAALITLGSAGFTGNGSVHWGEAWSMIDFDVLPKSQSGSMNKTNAAYDPWLKMRTEGKLIFDSTWKTAGPDPSKVDVYDVASATSNYDPARELDGGGVVVTHGKFEGAFQQNIPAGTLTWPDFKGEYLAFKEQAIAHGRYYGTDAGGNVYRDGIKDAEHLVDFNTEFGNADRVNTPYDLVFIDTIDGDPPAADGSNLSTVKNSGTGVGMKGVFYLCGNLEQGGAGNPAALNCEKPDLTMELIPKVYLDGVMYTAGWTDLGGNPVVYGCSFSEGGYKSGGTPEVYYNHRLRDGLEIGEGTIGSTFKVAMEKNYGPEN